MMNPLQNLDLSFKSIAKVVGIIVLLAVGFSFVTSLIGSMSNALGVSRYREPQVARSVHQGKAMMAMEEAVSFDGMMLPPEPGLPGGYGDDAERFEISEYSASFRKRNAGKTCEQILDLKAEEEVIFENANSHDTGCNFRFKVVNNSVDRVLEVLDSLSPESLSENTYSIQKNLQNLDSQSDILQKKLESVESTLEDALDSYDEISQIATRSQDADALATIIDSKVRLIERLTQQRMSINTQLDQLAKQQAQQLDRLAYTFFSVNVYESKVFNFKQIREEWRVAMQNFVHDTNQVFQGVTINLVLLVLRILQYVIYAFVLLYVAKYTWKLGRKVWFS